MRGAAVIAAALILEGAQCGDFPPAPFTSRAILSEWGPPVSGLSARLAMDSAQADLGSEVRFEILLRAEPRSDGVSARILNAYEDAQGFRLIFRDASTGKSFVRVPRSYGGPTACQFPSDRFDLYEGAVRAEGAEVPLLSHEGVYVPAGNYLVHAVYQNDAPMMGVRVGEDGLHYEQVEYPANLLWKGEVETGSVSFEVVHQEPEIIHFEIPAVQLKEDRKYGRKTGVYRWHWLKEPILSVEVTHWPGYLVGLQLKCSYRAIGESSWHRSDGLHVSMVSTPSRSLLFENAMWAGTTRGMHFVAPQEMRIEFILFESSGSVSKGGFRGANYRILYAWDVIQTWPPAKDNSKN